MSIAFTMTGVEAVLREIQKAGQEVERKGTRAMYRIGTLVKDTAQKYAPISPSMSQMASIRRGSKAQLAAAKKRRKASATTRAKPGTLQNAIQMAHAKDRAEIFVPSNSGAGKYAFRIHEEGPNGTGAWANYGIGTLMKGNGAGDKFIKRAIDDKERDIERILLDETGRGFGG